MTDPVAGKSWSEKMCNARKTVRESLEVFAWVARTTWRACPGVTAGLTTTTAVNALLSVADIAILWWGVTRLVEAYGSTTQMVAAAQAVAMVAIVPVLVGAVNQCASNTLMGRFYHRVNLHLEMLTLRKSAEVDLSMVESAADSDMLAKRSGLKRTSCQLMSSMLQAVHLAVNAIATVVVCVLVGWQAVVMVAVLIALQVVMFLEPGRGRSQKLSQNEHRERSNAMGYAHYLLSDKSAARELRILGLKDYLLERYARLTNEMWRFQNEGSWRAMLTSAVYAAQSLVLIGLAYWLALRVASGASTLALALVLLMALNAFKRSSWAVYHMSWALNESRGGVAAWESFMAVQPTIKPEPQLPSVPTQLGGGLTLENVTLQYATAKTPALQDICLTIRPGERIALVGENGSGKTTLVKILTRLYDPTQGRVLLDGKDLREYNVASHRKRIGVIFQDFVRYHGSVIENVAFGDPDRMNEEDAIHDALRKSAGDAVVATLPDGLKTRLGSWFAKGTDLSDGQWQKIALARAFFREADLLILDEPTAALDPRAEYDIFKRFLDLTRGKTTVLISHRFSTVRMADTIYVFHQGRIVERGSHRELMARGGQYAELFNMQAEGYLKAGEGHRDEALAGVPA